MIRLHIRPPPTSTLSPKQAASLSFSSCVSVVHCTARKIPLMYSFSGNSAALAPISTFLCLWSIYSPRIGIHISSSRIGRLVAGIYRSLTDAWMWKLGLRPQNSISGNICFEISVFCLCSVCPYYRHVRGEVEGVEPNHTTTRKPGPL